MNIGEIAGQGPDSISSFWAGTKKCAVHSSVSRPGWGMPDSGAGLCVIGSETLEVLAAYLAESTDYSLGRSQT